MHDPIEELRDLDPGTVVGLLPAAEVRRRGDRMRRRRTGVQALGAAAAVVVIASGGALAAGVTRSAPRPVDPAAPTATAPVSPSGSASASEAPAARAEIPEDFPLGSGYPTVTSSEQRVTGPGPDVEAFASVDACKTTAYPSTTPGDRLAVTYSEPEDLRSRELTTYSDSRTATSVVARLVDAFRACPRQSTGGTPETVTLSDVRRGGLGDEGYVVVQGYESGGAPALGQTLLAVVRVGNAVLLSSTSSEALPDAGQVDRAVAKEEATLRPVVDAMCVFSADGCRGAEPSDPTSVTPAAETLGPHGIGDFRLGVPLSEDHWGVYGEHRVNGCTAFKLADYDLSRSDGPDGWATDAGGVVALVGRSGYPTPEGITVGSTLAQVRAAYAHLTGSPDTVLTAPASDVARYVFEMHDGTVAALRLELTDQSCVF